jgi:transposase
VPWQGNSDRAIVQRFISSKILIDGLNDGFTYLTLDQTWIENLDCRNQRWAFRNEPCTNSVTQVNPRLALFAAIDTKGEVYLSMTQVNTNAEVFAVFMTKLVEKLQSKNKNFRQKTRLLLDNAAYQRNAKIMERFRLQGITVQYLGPYSFRSSPCEYLFSALKSVNLNPLRRPCVKK